MDSINSASTVRTTEHTRPVHMLPSNKPDFCADIMELEHKLKLLERGAFIMNIRKDIPLEAFTDHVEVPSRQNKELCVTILENGNLNMNSRLTKVLGGQKVDIAFIPDRQHLCIRFCDRIRVPKSGSCKLPMCLQMVREKGIALPAKYDIYVPEGKDYWVGELKENPTMKHSKVRHNLKKN